MNNSMWTWITAAVVVILVVIGLWWWHTKGAPMTAGTNLGYTASTTEAITGNNVPHTAPVHAQTRLGSVVAVLNSIQDASRFAQLLGKAGVASKLTGKGPYTLFVPINEAYGNLPSGSLDSLSSAQLKHLVEYHIIVGKAIDVNAQQSGTVEAMSQDVLNFSVRQGDKSARVNSAVALQSFQANNGIVYLIDNVLLPPTRTQ